MYDPKSDVDHLKGWGANSSTWGLNIYVQIEEGDLAPGENITIEYGAGPGDGAFVRYFEGICEFTVFVDPDGSRSAPRGGFYLIDGEQPKLRVVADEPSKLFITIPSRATADEPIDAKITVRDREGNTVNDFERTMFLSGPNGMERSHRFGNGESACCVVAGLGFQSTGIHRVSVSDSEIGIPAQSNPCICSQTAPEHRLYWGDIHVMTEISAGLGRPAEAYRYACGDAHLDFCATTDGDHADSYYTDEEWEETRQAVRDFNEPGRFVTVLASEYHERKVAGDKNIYYPTDDVPLIRWSDLEGEQPEALWKVLEGQRALTIPHHTSTGSVRYAVWEHHHPKFQRLVEIYSIWGNSESEGCHRPGFWINQSENSVQSALARGYRLGILASGDSHDGLPGNSEWLRLRRGYHSGMVAVMCHELTREAVFDALWQRRCYGTTGARIFMDFKLNETEMGQELTAPEDRASRRLSVEVHGTAPIEEVTVIRNGREVHNHRTSDRSTVFEWTDEEDFDSVSLLGYDGTPFIYYYIRIFQEDTELAWSSPIWISDQSSVISDQ